MAEILSGLPRMCTFAYQRIVNATVQPATPQRISPTLSTLSFNACSILLRVFIAFAPNVSKHRENVCRIQQDEHGVDDAFSPSQKNVEALLDHCSYRDTGSLLASSTSSPVFFVVATIIILKPEPFLELQARPCPLPKQHTGDP